jgi:protein-tyrosine phosphatase
MISGIRRIDNFLFRGPQLKPENFKRLQYLGINTIVDFRVIGQKAEAKLAQKYGMDYVNIPINPVLKVKDTKINKFFELVDNARQNNKKIFIHCRYGKDRTGLFAAMYKLKNNLADFKACADEMIQMGYKRKMFPALHTCLEKFHKTLLT